TSGNNLRPRVQPWHARLQGEKRYTLPERERFLRRSGLVMHRESKHAAPGGLTVILSVGLAAVCLWAVPASAGRLKCPRDSVKVGNVCIDTYEESVWQIPLPNKSLISAVLAGKATLADLTAGGPTQLSPSPSCSPGYPATFPASGQWTPILGSNPPSPGVYAVSISGVSPSACITWFAAAQACRLSDKRLMTNLEWQDAAAGTPDPGTDDGTTDCNVN